MSHRPLSGGAPFVLFEDARPGGGEARVFTSMYETIVANAEGEIEAALDRLRDGLRRGLHAAGWLSYEAGRAFEQRLMTRASRRQSHRHPLLWFALFDGVERIPTDALAGRLPDPDGAWISSPRPRISRAKYQQAFARAKAYIVAGDIYQINLSYRADLTLLGDPLAAYARMRAAGQGGWSGIVHTGETWLLSTSPELFFRLSKEGAIEARPMKGTARRHADPEQDRLATERLKDDPKEIAENVMIVDLLRNDISRLAKRGSVHVPELFTVETYPTLHALTSTVRAEIKDGHDVADVLRALFPCGSITGAPKIRAMEIIDELEADTRGPYTGSMGWIAPDGAAEFNVAIRTVAISQGKAEVGLGSAVVFDSSADAEWEECRTKGAFLTAAAKPFDLIETMRFEPSAGIQRLDLHLARLRQSAEILTFAFDECAMREALASASVGLREALVVRLTLSSQGRASVTLKPLPAYPPEGPLVRLRPLPVAASDFRLRHKTTDRDFFDEARAQAGADEVVFVDRDGFITEASIANVFVERHGTLMTPPASRGLLPGVLRADLLTSGRALEGELRPRDLEGGFLLGNAVRGLVPARLAPGAGDQPAECFRSSSIAMIK